MNTNDINNLLDKIKQIDDKNLSRNQVEELRQLENKLKDFINIESNIQLLNIDESLKKELIKSVKNKESYKKYGLVWENQDENKIEELKVSYPILKKQCEIKNDNTIPTNILIQGDNLHALYMLTYTHKEKIDIITIDPPYNTNKKEFIYNDKFIGDDDEYRHSKWLSFMKPRLELAKELLSEVGVIFIHIDEHEFAQLKILCDEIFGDKNFISNFIWINKLSGRQLDKHIANVNEYILCYSKNYDKVEFNKNRIFDESIISEYKLEDKTSMYKQGPALYNSNSKFNIETRKNLTYSIYYNPKTKECICRDEKFECDGKLILEEKNLLGDEYVKIIPPIRKTNNKRGCWRWSIQKFEDEYKDEIMIVQNSTGKYMAYTKDRLTSEGFKELKFKNLINDIPSTSGTNEIINIFKENIFDYPKPLKLNKLLLNMYSNKNSIILDFFAGSGTTGHAVLDLNKEDNGNRQFILCTNNEVNETKQNEIKKELKGKGLIEDTLEWKNEKEKRMYEEGICKKVTYPRLEKVINGYTNSKGKEIEGLGGNLKYYKIEMEEKKETKTQNVENLVDKLNPIISIAENCFNGYKQKKGKYVLFNNDDNTKIVGVCTTPWSSASLKEEIINELKNSGIEEKIMYINAENLNIKTSLDDREDWKDIIFKSIPTELLSNYTLNDYIIDNID